MGVELYEVRALLGNVAGSGQTRAISRSGNYALHAKLFVFDRQKVFIGSMNFDQRCMHLNTEIGLLIDSPALAQQIAARFDAMVQPENAYAVALDQGSGGGARAVLAHARGRQGRQLRHRAGTQPLAKESRPFAVTVAAR